MSRVIQDSDDDMEDELEAEIETHHRDKDASPKHSDTSSTEALRQQIETAHRAHLQSQFSVQDGHISATFEVNPQKRKLPANFDSNSASNEASGGQIVTDDIPLNGTSGSQHVYQQPVIDSVSHSAQPTDGTDWLLEGTMRDAYVEHDPNSMFPDASSTVPNATLTQQRVMNGILAPAFLGSDVDTERAPFQPDASIPWSEYLRSPTDTAEHPESSGKEPGNGSSLSTLGRRQPKSQVLLSYPPTQCSPRASMNAQGFTLFSNGGPPSQETIQHAQPQRKCTSSSSVMTTQGEDQSSSWKTVKDKRNLSPEQGSEDDLADLGAPKEQYLPRPSRSRSSRVGIQETIDYSVRPEKAARTTRRGRSSPRPSHDMTLLSTPDRIRQICEMGFTPSTSARALRKNNGDVTQTVDWLITNRIADDELLSHTSRMSNIDDERPGEDLGGSKGHNLDTANGTLEAFTVPNPDVKSPSRVQVVIPARLPNSAVETSHENFKRKKSKPAPIPTPTDDTPEATKVEKKRGRGRPKKAIKASYSENIIQAKDSQQPHGDEDAEITTDAKPNRDSNHSQLEGITAAKASTRATPEPVALPDRPEMEPITPERVKKPTPREQASSNRAKVPYRVGLSKRARIAPLLRTVKK